MRIKKNYLTLLAVTIAVIILFCPTVMQNIYVNCHVFNHANVD